MKVLCEYKFINNKKIRVELIGATEIKKRGLNAPDHFVLVFKEGRERTEIGLRPDEMVQLITLLSYALYVGIDGYRVKCLKGYNGFKFK